VLRRAFFGIDHVLCEVGLSVGPSEGLHTHNMAAQRFARGPAALTLLLTSSCRSSGTPHTPQQYTTVLLTRSVASLPMSPAQEAPSARNATANVNVERRRVVGDTGWARNNKFQGHRVRGLAVLPSSGPKSCNAGERGGDGERAGGGNRAGDNQRARNAAGRRSPKTASASSNSRRKSASAGVSCRAALTGRGGVEGCEGRGGVSFGAGGGSSTSTQSIVGGGSLVCRSVSGVLTGLGGDGAVVL
jgi:hypothetical protein